MEVRFSFMNKLPNRGLFLDPVLVYDRAERIVRILGERLERVFLARVETVLHFLLHERVAWVQGALARLPNSDLNDLSIGLAEDGVVFVLVILVRACLSDRTETVSTHDNCMALIIVFIFYLGMSVKYLPIISLAPRFIFDLSTPGCQVERSLIVDVSTEIFIFMLV